jgi:hypothetical protein
VQPTAERGGCDHPEQPQRHEQNHEKHQHGRSPRNPLADRMPGGSSRRICVGSLFLGLRLGRVA